jgi:hypothetical protein
MQSKVELFRTIITHMEKISISVCEIMALSTNEDLVLDPELVEIVGNFLNMLDPKMEEFHRKIMNHAVKTGVLPPEFKVPVKGMA